MAKVPLAPYIRQQATAAGIVNAVLNPLIEWITNREKGFVPIWASDGMVVNIALTSVILSVLVALFAARGLHKELHGGHLATGGGESPRAGRLLAQLPSRAWLLGLLLGVGAAAVVTLAFWLFHALGISGLSFGGFLVFKAVYCGLLGFVVARWVILRQVSEDSRAS